MSSQNATGNTDYPCFFTLLGNESGNYIKCGLYNDTGELSVGYSFNGTTGDIRGSYVNTKTTVSHIYNANFYNKALEISLVRSSTTIYVCVDGKQILKKTISGLTIKNETFTCTIGRNLTNLYLSEFRVLKKALSTAAQFASAYNLSTQHTKDSNTLALLHVVNGSIKEECGLDISMHGNYSISKYPSSSKEKGYALQFPGPYTSNGNYISLANFDKLIKKDLSIECFCYIANFANTGRIFELYDGSSKLNIEIKTYPGIAQLHIGSAYSQGEKYIVDWNWHHFMLCYEASTKTSYVYIDGELDSKKTGITANSKSDTLYIMHSRVYSSVGGWVGSMAEFRVSDCVRQTADSFIPDDIYKEYIEYNIKSKRIVLHDNYMKSSYTERIVTNDEEIRAKYIKCYGYR